ncbi:hypothetical protein BH20ACI4_BH20ACI4_22170 [soil metagenome]
MKTLHIKASKVCEKLIKLERQGRYEEALSEIGDLWQDKSELPDTEGLTQSLAAELVLRCGSLFGFLGHNKQIPNSQEKSRNLLSQARNLFIELYNVEKIAECENHLALTYSRKGEVKEADAWLDEAFSHNLSISDNMRIYTYVIRGLVLFSARKYQEMLDLLLPLEKIVKNCPDYCLKGAFHNQIGNAWEKLGNIPNALRSLETAKDFYQKARHQVYYGAILNDLAFLCKAIKDFDKAHQMIDAATDTFKKIKDRSREGFSLDTKAGIYQSEGKFDAALKTIEKAVDILKLGENSEYLVETLGTKVKILISSDAISSATFCLMEAVEIAKTQISEEAANNLVNDYETFLRDHLNPSKPVLSEIEPDFENCYDKLPRSDPSSSLDSLELVLPPSLSMYEEIQGIWINNTHLENAGLVRDSLAVVAHAGNIQRGDLIALEETETENVSCGFYDFGFGIVCLEGYDSEPLLFDDGKISIIGKIVGVATERTPDGKMIVEPISL